MRKGLLSFIIYAILFGGFGILTLITKLQIDAAEGTDGFNGLGLALGFVIYLICTIVLAVPFVIKLIHIISGWGFFGFLAVLVDLALIGFLVYAMFIGLTIDVSIITVGLIAVLGAALCSDISSLKS